MEQGMLAEQLEQDYQLKNLLLAYPNDWFIDKETLEKTKLSLPNLLKFYKSEGTQNPDPTLVQSIIEETVKDVYKVPLFSQTFCNLLIDEMKNLESFYGFTPNPDEDKLRQIAHVTDESADTGLGSGTAEALQRTQNTVTRNHPLKW